MGQLSFYSADALPRALSDLEGVLCGRGQVVMFGRGRTARLSVVVGAPPPPPPDDDDADPDADADAGQDGTPSDAGPEPQADPAPDGDDGDGDGEPDPGGTALDPADLEFLDLDPEELAAALAPRGTRTAVTVAATDEAAPAPRLAIAPHDPIAEWRARALCCAFRTRGIDAEIDRAPDGRPVVRTAFRADLVGLARRWTRGAVKALPDDLEVDGPRLRLWVLASGRWVGHAYVLGLDPHAEHTHGPLLTACHRAGLAPTLGGARGDPVLRIVGRRRQGRLGELVGDAPRDLAAGVWPG